MAFIFRKKPVQQPVKKQHGPIEVYVGVDFGTTFTKVSYQIGDREGTIKYSLRFANDGCETDYCLPSVLGYDSEHECLIFIDDPDDCEFEVIRYFKYSMIQKNVPRSKSFIGYNLNNDPQRLCSAFYIAHVLKLATQFIAQHLPYERQDREIRWYINMGVPVSDCAAKPKPIYDEALNVAWQLVESGVLRDEMKLVELDRFYSQWIDHSRWSNRLNTVPELYAEIIMFLQDRTVDTGFYSVIDIGGGTVDLAVFFKRIDVYTHRVEIMCVAQDVCPLGFEMYKSVIAADEARMRLQISYGSMICHAYDTYRTNMLRVKESKRHLIHFYMGGARNVSFYHECVDDMIKVHKDTMSCYPGSVNQDMVIYMRNKVELDVDDNHRLLISQMLAQPFEKMPELTGQAWNLEKTPPQKNAPPPEDLMLSIYGDC